MTNAATTLTETSIHRKTSGFPWRLALLFAAFCLLATFTISKWQETKNHPYRSMEVQGHWITTSGTPSYSGYFRKKIRLPSPVAKAWLMIAAEDAFEVSVNKNPIGRSYLWRPTRPFQCGASEKGQLVSSQAPAMAMNFPREYQWGSHDNWLLPVWLDITTDLSAGENIICVELESRTAPARVHIQGQVLLTSGELITIQSDQTWKSEPVPPGLQSDDWTHTSYRDLDWRTAQTVDGPAKKLWRNFPSEIFTRPFVAPWMQAPQASSESGVEFTTDWTIHGSQVDEAWLRIATNRKFDLFINDTRVTVPSVRSPDEDNGLWILGRESSIDPVTRPNLLDPDEVSSFFVGKKFETPRKGDANLEEFINLKPKTHSPFTNYRTTNRAEPAGEFEPTRTLAESRRTGEPSPIIDELIPNSLKRDRSEGAFFAYNVSALVHPGTNTIKVRYVDLKNVNWSPRMAIDGAATTKEETNSPILSGDHWKTQRIGDANSFPQPVALVDRSNNQTQSLPRMEYRGIAMPPAKSRIQFLFNGAAVLLVSSFVFLSLFYLLSGRTMTPTGAVKQHATGVVFRTILLGSLVLITGILLNISWQERQELLWFERGTGWLCILVATFLAMSIEAARGFISQMDSKNSPKAWCEIAFSNLASLPETRYWKYFLIWGLLLCALLRGYKLDVQPLDDDEYASTQAIVSILETGTPAYQAEDVYYTRSPLFHYFTAVVAYPFGANLWALRLQSVGWSVATAWLVYLCGAHLLRSRWIGFAALLLLAIHPFEIFTGHVIRFYQMQQFFALLTVYFFCRGFVHEHLQIYRIATLFAFLAAFLSQEITAVMGFTLVIGYLVFAKDLGWSKNIQLILVAASVVLVMALDLVAFRTLCLTRVEGVSPSAEAAIQPQFSNPLNFFALLIGYSRIHLIPSFFLVIGLPLIWKSRLRNSLALVAFLFSGIVMSNIMISHVSLRYQYWLFPIWILVSLDCMRLIFRFAIDQAQSTRRSKNNLASMAVCCMTVLLAIVLSWSPWKIIDSYETKILGDSTGCVRWVRSQMRQGDQLAITEPHTHAGYLESGKVDYDIAVPILYDFAVVRDGKLVDRNGGGELVSSVDELIKVIETGNRVWILFNREKFRTRGKNMRWEYPGARFETFVRNNCELKYRSYLWHAFLWDPSRGHFENYRRH